MIQYAYHSDLPSIQLIYYHVVTPLMMIIHDTLTLQNAGVLVLIIFFLRFYRRFAIFFVYFIIFMVAVILRPGSDLCPTQVASDNNTTVQTSSVSTESDSCYLIKACRTEDKVNSCIILYVHILYYSSLVQLYVINI